MKKRILMVVLVLVLALALAACGCKHETWNDADCVNPKTCAECGETEGAPLGHTWKAAVCEAPKTCEVCAATEGEALGHDWQEATCEAPKTCGTCKLTEGEALGHDWQDATTEAPKTCAACAMTEGERIITDSRFTTAATADIQGTWVHEFTADGELMGLEGFEGEFGCVITLNFGNDGSMNMKFAPKDDKEWEDAFRQYLVDSLYAELKAAGYSKEQADKALIEEMGVDIPQYAALMMNEIDLAAMFDMLNIEFVYYVDGGSLYLGMSWKMEMEPTPFTVEGDNLTLDDDVAGTGAEQTVFTRVIEE